MFRVETLYEVFGDLIYACQALVALWGIYCVIMVWRRIAEKRFRTEESQAEFLDEIELHLARREFDEAGQTCGDDARALPQLVHLAMANRQAGFEPVRRLVTIRFQRDVLGELDHQLSWVNTMIKSAPMAGLYGTVLGMMGAFGQLSLSEKVSPTELAGNIMLALITTALGLTIAIPLIIAVNSITLRIRKLEELVGYGTARVMDCFRQSQGAAPDEKKQPRNGAAGAQKQPLAAAAAGEN